MKIIAIIFIACLALITSLKFVKTKESTKVESVKTTHNKEEAEQVVKRLDDLGYFKYADEADIDSLKSNFIKEFDPEGELTTIWDEDTHLPKDFRYYFCDGEEVYEEGGITELLNDLNTVFSKMNFKCEISNHFEEWDNENEWLNHEITINGTKYQIFKNFKEYGWGEAPFRIAQILNIELQKQNIDEQIYLVNGGNDGRLALLTKNQYTFIYSIYKDKAWKPLEINEWAKEFDLKPMKLD